MTAQGRQLTAEQQQALRAFAKKHGRYWKQELRWCWETGRYEDSDDSASLQQVRNGFGPSWLVRFRLTWEVR